MTSGKKCRPSVTLGLLRATAQLNPTFKAISLLVGVAALCLGSWRLVFYKTKVDEGLAVLRRACESRRPLEARLSGFPFAPFVEIRGTLATSDTPQLDLAERLVLEGNESGNPKSSHAVGLVYLAKHDLDKAIQSLQQAVLLNPQDPAYQNDLGAALMERASQAADKDENSITTFELKNRFGRGEIGLEDIAQAFGHFAIALQLNSASREVMFNRALCLERGMIFGEADEAWRDYLSVDPTSAWAIEAKKHLEDIQLHRARTLISKTQLLDSFIDAWERGENDRAWSIYSENRELITGRILVDQLLDRFLDSREEGKLKEAERYLGALQFLGKMEEERCDDHYGSDVAKLCSRSTNAQIRTLSVARASIRAGEEQTIQSNFGKAEPLYSAALDAFEQVADKAESACALYWQGYISLSEAHLPEAGLALQRALHIATGRHYRWLRTAILEALASISEDQSNESLAITDVKDSLAEANQISDAYSIEKELAELGRIFQMLGNAHLSARYLQRSLAAASNAWPGARQAWRTYRFIGTTLAAMGQVSAATEYHRECLRIALVDIQNDPSVTYLSYVDLGSDLAQCGQQDRGLEFLAKGLEIAKSESNSEAPDAREAYAWLRMGDGDLASRNYGEGLRQYEQAIDVLDSLPFGAITCDAHKGRFQSLVGLRDVSDAERELINVIALLDQHRSQLVEDANRISFLGLQQSVYDTAIDLEFTDKDDPRRAFEFSETSRARSLLAMMRLSSVKSPGPGVDEPLALEQIQDRLAKDAQIIQYSVLPDKILIWVVSSGSFRCIPVRVPESTMLDRVSALLRAIEDYSRPEEELEEQCKWLYSNLVAPAEDALDQSKKVFIVPDKFLASVPFCSLLSPASNQYFIQTYGIPVLSASATILVACSDIASRKPVLTQERILGVGNPSFSARAYPQLSPLPDAAREVVESAEMYNRRETLIGPRATYSALRSSVRGANVLVLAAHYIIDPLSPSNSKLLLADDGVRKSAVDDADRSGLDQQSVADLDLSSVRLVVLSACQSGVEGYQSGEGLMGLCRAFIGAGCPLVVASLWPVESKATADLMINFHKYRTRDGSSTANALRKAEVDLLTQGDDPRLRSPRYWASFTVIGGDADF